MNWNRFIILIVSIVCIGGATKLVIACAGGEDPYELPSFFLNTINKPSELSEFYYSPYLHFYRDTYTFDTTKHGYLPDLNISLWKEYTGNQVPEKDIDSFVYEYPKQDIEPILNHIKKGETLRISENVAKNAFTKWLIKNKETAVLQYLLFAKTCERYAISPEYTWDDKKREYIAQDSVVMGRLIVDAIKQYDVQRDNELKLRYAYQAIRMAFYNRQYLQTVALFDNMVVKCENVLYYRCLALKAGGLYKAGRKAEAAYYYSLVFEGNKEDRSSAYMSFRWAVNGNIESVLKLCRSDHERAILYIMKGLYEYDANDKNGVEVLERAYNYDAKVIGLDVVMTREINKAECEAIAGITGGKNKNNIRLMRLNEFAQKVAKAGRSGDAAYWYLCAAYIYILQGDVNACRQFLVKAHAEKMTPSEEDVHDIVDVLCVMMQDKKIVQKTEEQLLPMLKSVEAKGKRNERYNILLGDLLVMVMKNAYLQQGDTVKAVYCYSKAGGAEHKYPWNYATDYTDEPGRTLDAMNLDRLHAMEAFIAKKNKSPFEAWLTDSTMYTPVALYELEGTKYIRMFQFDKAVEVLKKVPDILLCKTELPDIMVNHILDGQELNKSDRAVTYNKLTFAKKMRELQQALSKNPKDGRAAYQYANGLYNMSYYGKAHHAYDYYRSGTDEYAYFNYKDRGKLAAYELEHYNVQTPERYYVQAYENSTDKEIKARCLFMAAKCWQKNCPETREHEYYDADIEGYYRNTFKNPYLLQLKNGYKDTKFFSSATGTCSYFKDYVKRK